MEGQEENVCRSQVPRGATLCHYFQPGTPGTVRKALETTTPKRRRPLSCGNKEEAYSTPENVLLRSPMTKPPTLIRKRRRRELSPINEAGSCGEDDAEESLSQRLKQVMVSPEEVFPKEPLPCYFEGKDFDLQHWKDKARNFGATRDPGFGPQREAKVGRGDFATVYRSRDELTGAVGGFALKESRNMDHWRKILFLKEAQALAMVEGHPNIVRYQGNWLKKYSDGMEEQQVILTELCDSDIQDPMLGGDVSEDRLKKIVLDIASALSYIHSLGVVHMDVKPANIMVSTCEVTGLETFKLGDFGMATRIDGKGETTRGTTRYMDTYHFGWGEEAEKLDTFSLAATICDVASGQQLSYELTQECVERTWMTEIPEVSKPFKFLLQDMLATDRNDRPSAEEVLERVKRMDD